jgi:hypothetical protein
MDKNNSDYIFKAFIVNSFEYDNGNKETSGAWLHFPTTKDEVSALFEKIGLPNNAAPDKYFIDEYEDKSISIQYVLPQHANIDELNYLAHRIKNMNLSELPVFEDAVEAGEHTKNIVDLINLTYNLECYNIIPDMYCWENVGAYFAEKEGFDVSELGDLADFIDYEKYGKYYAEQNGGHFLNDVYLETDLADFTTEYYGSEENIPSECIVTENGENIQYDYRFDFEFQESVDLSVALDSLFRNTDESYSVKYPDDFEQQKYFFDCLILQSTVKIKNMLENIGTDESGELLKQISDFEQKYPCDVYMIYQVKDGEATRDYRYTPHSLLEKWGLSVSKDNYEHTYTCALGEDTTLESLFTKFNTDLPKDFEGHSMSVSDIVVFRKNGEEKAYYCDTAGFVEVPEFLSEPEKELNKTMTVLVVEPLKEPYTKEIDSGLKSLQNEVGGNIQAVYPFAKPAAIICNEDGKINGLKLNRALYDAEGEIYDIVAGTFLIAGLSEDNFTSLPPELIKSMSDQFKAPEIFASVNGKIAALPVKPHKQSIREQLKQSGKEISQQEQKQRKPPNVEL